MASVKSTSDFAALNCHSNFNGVFSIIDATTDRLALLSDRMVDGISLIIRKLFAKKNKKSKEKENDDNE